MNIRELKQKYKKLGYEVIEIGYEVIETSCKSIYVLKHCCRSKFEEKTYNLESLEEHLFEIGGVKL